MSVPKSKSEQIATFYLFHKKVYSIFNEGVNLLFKFPQKKYLNLMPGSNLIKNFYILNRNWINCWKMYSQYNDVKKI